MKQYFQGKGVTIPFKHVTCVQCKDDGLETIFVSLMVNTIAMHEEDSNKFLEEYHAWLDSLGVTI